MNKKIISLLIVALMVFSFAQGFSFTAAAETASSIEINPVNGVNPMSYTENNGSGSPRFRDFFRYDTADTFIRPGESVTYNAMVDGVAVAGSDVTWTITGGVVGTAISADGKLTVDATQPAGDIIVTATVDDVSTSATVTVRIVSDAVGYDQSAKWGVDTFKLSEVTLDSGSLWYNNRDITLRYLLQGDREERHLKWFYNTAGITELPVAINGKAAGTPVSSLAAPLGWDGIGYATTSRVWQRALSGHGTGHYLSALAKAYQVEPDTADKATFLSKMALMVDQLKFIQDTNIAKGSYMYGFLSAYSEHQFDVLEEDKGATPTTGETNGRAAWAIYYTQHKIIQGLLDIYTTLEGTENDATAQRALEIASKMGDWTYLRLSRWTQAERENMWNVYSAGEVGGIAIPIEQLYFITGDELYRETATFFEHNNNWNRTGTTGVTTMGTGATAGYEQSAGKVTTTTRSADAFFAHFAKNENGSWLNSKHANTIVPMIIASLREYEADTPLDNERINPVGYTPVDTHYYDIAKNFFRTVYTTRLSPIGGTANGETWRSIGNPVTPTWANLPAGTGTTDSNESCTTANLMILATSLFKHEQRAEYMDYYEKALINHVMPTLAQNSPADKNYIDYLTSVGTNATRSHDRYGDGACCNGTGMELHTSYQDNTYYKTKDGKGVYVNLYLPSTMNWTEKGFKIVQTNDYLNEGKSTLTIAEGNGPLDIMLRVPYWVEKGFEVKVNGEVVIENAAKSSYVTLSRNWTSGDVIEISMPFSARIERGPENTTNTTAILFYGPILMVQRPGVATRPAITGLNLADLDSSFTKTTGPENTHSFGNYTAFRLTYNNQNYDPFYTATTRNTTYCLPFTVARDNDNVAVNTDVTGGNGTIGVSSNSRTVTDGQLINRGSTVTFTANPGWGYIVKEWKVNGLTVGGNTSEVYILTGINQNTVVTVEFEELPPLNILVLKCEDKLVEADYTADSWNVLAEALSEAKALLADTSSTQSQLDKAYNKLALAYAGLVSSVDPGAVNKTELAIYIEVAEDILVSEANELRPSTINALQDALTLAKYVNSSKYATQEMVDDVAFSLLKTIVNRKDIVDKSDLNELIAIVEGLDSSKFEQSTWPALTEALASAKLINAESEIAEVRKAYYDLQDAFNALELLPVTNKSALLSALNNAKAILDDINSFTPSSVAGLADLYAQAQAVYDSINSTQSEVSSITNQLVAAIAKARAKADTTALVKALAQASSLKAANYTSASYAALTSAVKAAQAVVDDNEVTQTVVDKNTTAVNNAINGLVPVAASVKVSGLSKNMVVGETATATATVTPSNTGTVKWTSSDSKIASINATTGKVTAKSAGKATITATASGKTATYTITVHQYVSMKIGSTKAIQNGNKVTIDNAGTKPFKIGGRTMIPVRFVGEKMGGKVKYVSDSQPITMTYGDITVELKLGSKSMKVIQGGKSKTVTLDVAAQKKNGKTYIPLRAISESLGFAVYYEAGSEYIVVNSPAMSADVRNARLTEAKGYIK